VFEIGFTNTIPPAMKKGLGRLLLVNTGLTFRIKSLLFNSCNKYAFTSRFTRTGVTPENEEARCTGNGLQD
jgi:hypothetical protein